MVFIMVLGAFWNFFPKIESPSPGGGGEGVGGLLKLQSVILI